LAVAGFSADIRLEATMDDRHDGRSLKDRDADQIRNEQRGGGGSADPRAGAPEANDTLQKVWSDPGGEAYNYRNAMVGAGGKADDHSDLTAAKTPETTKHLSDATLSRDDIVRAGSGAAERKD
jgi:hypothetical protein